MKIDYVSMGRGKRRSGFENLRENFDQVFEGSVLKTVPSLSRPVEESISVFTMRVEASLSFTAIFL
jgi:hypothetical protein